MRMVTAAKGPGRVGLAASSSETSRIGTLGSERISGSPTTTAARSGGAMTMVAVPVSQRLHCGRVQPRQLRAWP